MTQGFFADAFYFIALLSPRDAAHKAAVGLSRRVEGRLLSTDAVLLEVADALSSPEDRPATATFIRELWRHPGVKVRVVDRGLLERGLALYESRADKNWGLTDCISFVVMQEEGIDQALTGDSHFEQAGFKVLFPAD